MLRLLLALSIWLGAALSCAAGAWMRGEGEGFLSLGFRGFEDAATREQWTEQTFFFEYGLRPRLTLGAQANYTQGQKGEGSIFLRLPLRDDERPAKISAEIAVGARSIDWVSFDPFLKTGLSWGRGVTVAGRGGWVNVDGAVQWSSGDTPPLFKLDATVGLTLSDRFKVMGQGFLEADEFGESLSVAPSVIYTPKRGRTKYVVGFEHKTGRDESTGIRFGLWREF